MVAAIRKRWSKLGVVVRDISEVRNLPISYDRPLKRADAHLGGPFNRYDIRSILVFVEVIGCGAKERGIVVK